MPAPFAAAISRANRAVIGHLADAAAVVGGVGVAGVFSAGYADPLGMDNSQPRLLVSATDLPAAAVGQTVVIGAASYQVQVIEPDGIGMLALILRRA